MNDLAPTKEFDSKAHKDLEMRAKQAEFYETPQWAADRILDVELMTQNVIDPCAGRGVLGIAARQARYENIMELDLNVWPGQPAYVRTGVDWLKHEDTHKEIKRNWKDATVLMNPPFSMACQFVEKSFELGARKIIMFQRLSFLESAARRSFFTSRPPARIWLCGERAHCWRGDMPEEDIMGEDGKIIKGKKGRSSPTAHAWFVWERGHRGVMGIHHLYKD